ncbi:adenine deaminase C-terminal domain-containing protein [Methanosarcina horonobensis]|uniref:adenine deaminase C-terminal domain-containing protein n=1 Tax=Methanosarcina horonobensis TaxID=418008 RepID=UPI002FCE150C
MENGNLVSDPARDILKMVVLSRYADDPVQIGFIKNIGLKKRSYCKQHCPRQPQHHCSWSHR